VQPMPLGNPFDSLQPGARDEHSIDSPIYTHSRMQL
jgi:hypothetical protein